MASFKQVRAQQMQHPAATAPYNFVPLPVRPVSAQPLPNHDQFDLKRHSGYFTVRLTTLSPVFVRAGLTNAIGENNTAFDLAQEQKSSSKADTPFRALMKNTPEFFYTQSDQQPVIPGSSLRGMIRSLVEIAAYAKFGPMSKGSKVFYRAVAAGNNDALGQKYLDALGRFGKKVRAGYLHKTNDGWQILPAKTKHPDFPDDTPGFVWVRDTPGLSIQYPDVKSFRSSVYNPSYHTVALRASVEFRNNKRFLFVDDPIPPSAPLFHGELVCTGNMATGADDAVQSKRRMFALVLEKDPEAAPLLIHPDAANDYADALTEFQSSPPYSKEQGVLQEGRPVFYVVKPNSLVRYFGHTPFFRIPALVPSTQRAIMPIDLRPKKLADPSVVDMAEAMFGFVRDDAETLKKTNQGDKRRAYSGRVYFSDAVLTPHDQTNLWLVPESEEALVSNILGSPKSTAFAHYLTQTADGKANLKHYDKDPAMRGHKRYWLKGDLSQTDLSARPTSKESERLFEKDMRGNFVVKASSTQHTQMRPVGAGKTFSFKVWFENLTNEELGALAWALHLSQGGTHAHSIGMGKPYGLGAIQLEPVLTLVNRSQRYGKFLKVKEGATEDTVDLANFELAETSADVNDWISHFESFVFESVASADKQDSEGTIAASFAELPRIRRLLKMAEWQKLLDPSALRRREYLDLDKFKERLVLPDPLDIDFDFRADRTNNKTQSDPPATQSKRSKKQDARSPGHGRSQRRSSGPDVDKLRQDEPTVSATQTQPTTPIPIDTSRQQTPSKPLQEPKLVRATLQQDKRPGSTSGQLKIGDAVVNFKGFHSFDNRKKGTTCIVRVVYNDKGKPTVTEWVRWE